jgi:hypothetical protein
VATRSAEKKRQRAERLERQRAAERAEARRRRLIGIGAGAVVLAIVAVTIALVASSGDEGSGGGQGGVQKIADVHGLGVNPADGTLYIATHTGLFASPPGTATATRVDAPEQDLMGFSVAGPDRFVASGHPGPGQGGPTSLGLIESTDRGRTWRSLSLEGEADFHLLRARGNTVYAFDGQLRLSTDGGRSWQERSAPEGLIDLAIDPTDPNVVLASTESGVRASRDGGRTWDETSFEEPALLAWAAPRRVAALGADTTVSTSTDGGRTWRPAGRVQGQVASFASDADGALYVARPDGAVDWSSDGGRTWRPRSRN